MNKIIPLIMLFSVAAAGQSLIASVNAGSLITNASSVSVGEIIIVPESPIQSSSGIIGILAQTNELLETSSFTVAANVVVYPNPTAGSLEFTSSQKLRNCFYFRTFGQMRYGNCDRQSKPNRPRIAAGRNLPYQIQQQAVQIV